jgi:LmbE family N-acetylglucosaminyl deacetylase
MAHSSAARTQPFNPDSPGTPEQSWQEALAVVLDWLPPKGPLLVVSPHPDDEVLGAGGLMRTHACAGCEVRVLSVTDGEAAHPGWEGLDRIRRRELREALHILAGDKIDIVHLGIPDGRVEAYRDEMFEAVEGLTRRGSILVAPYELDGHPDHEAAGRACCEIARTREVTLLRYPIWSWLHATPREFLKSRWGRLPLDAVTRRAKAKAIDCFTSQLRPLGRAPVVPNHVLPYFQRTFEAFLR